MKPKNFLLIALFISVLFAMLIFLLILNSKDLSLKNRVDYQYEICDDEGICTMVPVDKVIQPSTHTFNICNDKGLCEDVPINRLLLKEGTDKKYCSNAPYLQTDYVDNWWNANGLIDECEILGVNPCL